MDEGKKSKCKSISLNSHFGTVLAINLTALKLPDLKIRPIISRQMYIVQINQFK